MATTIAPQRPRRRSQQPRVSAPVSPPTRHARAARERPDAEYDLLTAALIGMTLGAGLTYMLRRGPSGRRPISPAVRGMGRGARWTGAHAARLGAAGARWAAGRSEALWDRVPKDEIREHVASYIGHAREAIDDAVESELTDLRRAIRRQRKRLGL